MHLRVHRVDIPCLYIFKYIDDIALHMKYDKCKGLAFSRWNFCQSVYYSAGGGEFVLEIVKTYCFFHQRRYMLTQTTQFMNVFSISNDVWLFPFRTRKSCDSGN